MAIFPAAKDAVRICEYMLGLATKREAIMLLCKLVAEDERG